MAYETHACVKVVVIEDDPMALETLLDKLRCTNIEVVAQCETAEQGLEAIKLFSPDVALVDLHLDDEQDGGINLIREIRKSNAHVQCCVVAGTDGRGRYLMEAILAGARGYWRKGYAKEKLPTIVQQLANGEISVDPPLAGTLLEYMRDPDSMTLLTRKAQAPKLRPRQIQVLELIKADKSNAQIAAKLKISIKTVKTYVRQIMDAYNVAGNGGRQRVKVISQLRANHHDSPSA